jgi:integrase
VATGVRKHGQRWQAWVYSKSDGRKIYKSFETMAAAKGWRADRLSEGRRAPLRAPTDLTLRDAWDAWLIGAEKGEILSRFRRAYKPSVLRAYSGDMQHYVLEDFGGRRLSDITTDDLVGLIERLNGQGFSGSKVRNVITPLQALYRRHRRQVLYDPTDGLADDLPAPAPRRERVASREEAAAMLEALADDMRPIYATATYAGLRRGELRALRVSDVNTHYIWVERGWDDHAGPIEPKSRAGIRHVPLPEILSKVLREHIVKTGRRGDDLIFGRTATDPFTPSHVRRKAGTEFNLHELRHSYGSYLARAGIPEHNIRRYLGHGSYDITSRYVHALEGDLERDAKTLNDYLSGPTSGAESRKANTGAE